MRLLALLTALSVSAASIAQQFGPPVIDRPMVDFAHEITFISGVHASPAAGEISQWRLWASGTGTVTLQMWRPISSGFQLVGANTLDIQSLGLNTLDISSGRIVVQAGDVIGFRYNQTTYGQRIIDFGQNSGGSYRWTNWPDASTNVPVGGVLTHSQLVGLGEAREYSLAATVVVPEPATGLMLIAGTALLLRRRRT